MAEKKVFDLGRRARALDDWSVRLSAPALPGGDGKEPFLLIDFQYTLNPKSTNEKFREIEMTVNLRKSGREGKIVFRPNIVQFGMLCQAIKDGAEGLLPDGMVKIEILNTFINGQRLNQPQMEFMVVVGNDDQGVFIGISQPGRDNVKFYFTPPRLTQLRNREGQILTNGYAGRLSALARVKIWQDHIDHMLRSGYMDDSELEDAKAAKKKLNDQRFAERQNGGGGYGGNGGGGYQQSQQQTQYQSTAAAAAPAVEGQTFDNDMPW